MKNLKILILLILIPACIDSTGPAKGRPAEPVTDIDGNTYETVKIGEQVWIVENLKVTHYRNGDPIPNVKDNTEWTNLTTGAYSDYYNDPSVTKTYGRYYNWYAAGDSRGLCPDGWRVPSPLDWTTLIDSQGGVQVAGGRLKTSGTAERGNGLWRHPNTSADNNSRFSALPADARLTNGAFQDSLGYYTYFWTSAEQTNIRAIEYRLFYGSRDIGRYESNKKLGFSVRCIRDDP